MIEKGSNIHTFNYQDFRPLDLSKKPFFNNKETLLFDQEENRLILKNLSDITALDTFNVKAIESVNENFIYLIISKDTEKRYRKCLVYKQLLLIKTAWKDKLMIKYMKPLQWKIKDSYRHYFLIKLDTDLVETLADVLDFQIFNLKRGYVTKFIKDKTKEYAKFRDYHIHQIVTYLLNKEFNLEHYKLTGIIEDAFPLHEFRTRQNLKENWEKEKSEIFFDPWKFKTHKNDLRPFNSMAFYYGCDIALYLSFTTLLTSFLIILTGIGILFYIITLFIEGHDIDNRSTPVYSIFIIFWVTVTYEKWKRRENEHAHIWNTNNFK